MSYGNREQWIARTFEQYGYTPDPGVISALTIGIPTDDQAGIASMEVGEFMNAVTQLNKAAASDPLTQILADENAALSYQTGQASTYASKVQDVYTQAPKLFGALTPEQIDQYLAPLKTQFDYSTGAAEGAAAKRGLTGSSVEANAMQDSSRKFQEDVLSAGLGVGMTQQQNQANVLQNLFNQYQAAAQNTAGLVQGTGTQKSQQGYANAQFLAQLPMLINAMATQQAQLGNQKGSFWNTLAGTLGSVVGGVAGGLYAGPMGAMAGASAGGSIGTGISSMATGEPVSGSQTAMGQGMTPLMALLAGNKTGNNMVPYTPTSTPNMGTAGTSYLPPGLSMNTGASGVAPWMTNPVATDSGMSWANQPGMK